eukprot:scaffold23524_cov221-Amphora_coffeaeformis.AAC.2
MLEGQGTRAVLPIYWPTAQWLVGNKEARQLAFGAHPICEAMSCVIGCCTKAPSPTLMTLRKNFFKERKGVSLLRNR